MWTEGAEITGEPTVAYAPNYFFFSTSPCSDELVEPGSEFSDYVDGLIGKISILIAFDPFSFLPHDALISTCHHLICSGK